MPKRAVTEYQQFRARDGKIGMAKNLWLMLVSQLQSFQDARHLPFERSSAASDSPHPLGYPWRGLLEFWQHGISFEGECYEYSIPKNFKKGKMDFNQL